MYFTLIRTRYKNEASCANATWQRAKSSFKPVLNGPGREERDKPGFGKSFAESPIWTVGIVPCQNTYCHSLLDSDKLKGLLVTSKGYLKSDSRKKFKKDSPLEVIKRLVCCMVWDDLFGMAVHVNIYFFCLILVHLLSLSMLLHPQDKDEKPGNRYCRESKEERMRPKKKKLHELPYAEIVKLGTIRLAFGDIWRTYLTVICNL